MVDIAFAPFRRGYLARHPDFRSRHVAARTIEVWLPEQYVTEPEQSFPVLYMHDGQNLWYPAFASGAAWDVDLALAELIDQGAVPPTLIVAIPNALDQRFAEYMPQAPCETPAGRAAISRALRTPAQLSRGVSIISDHYLAFLTEEVKPFIDAHYRTLTDAAHTTVMGSSMGGLISLYALTQHGEVFGRAGCVSTHWPALEGITVDWLPGHLPDPATHRFYFDYGTKGIDARYAPYQARVDALLYKNGYRADVTLQTQTFPGADHNEAAWAERVHLPLRFLLGADVPGI